MNIILCGMPKSGKTSIGKKLARALGWSFIDTDQMIVGSFGSSCRELFLQHGESGFRKMESQQIAALRDIQKTVISIGGGALLDPLNASHLQSLGLIVHLKVPLNILWGRNKINGVPAFAASLEDFKKLEENRLPIYERYATTHIDAYKLTTKEVIKTIMELQ